jgi:hypothetical protein
MRRARPDDDGASLDLLLDTITNTLGGILFLAILLVLLPKASRAMVGNHQHSASNVEELRGRLAAIQALAESRRVEAAVSDAVLEAVADPRLASELAEVAELRETLAELNAEMDRMNEAIGQLRAVNADLQNREEVVKAVATSAREDLASLKEEYSSELRRRRSDLPVPSERAARTTGAKITIRYGRLYFDRGRSPADDETVNLEDFVHVGVEGTHRVITPKPWGGSEIVVDDKLSSQVKRELNAWPARDYHLEIAVWDDSFDAMRLLRAYLASRRQAYRLIPVTDGDEVSEGYAENVRVQ